MSRFSVSVLIEAIDKASAPLKGVADKMQNVGKKMALTGGAITAGLGMSVKTFADFEMQMKEVAIKTNATSAEFEALSRQARELGASTMFSASEAAQGMTYLSMAGFEAEQIMAAMPGMLDVAAANSLELGRAADITSNILSQFALSSDLAGLAGDRLTATANNSNTSFEQLAEGMKMTGATAASLGQSLEDTSALMGALGNAGLQGSMAGTALNRMLLNLADASKQPKFKQLGIDIFDANGEMRSAIDIIGDLEGAMAGMSAEAQNALIGDLFDERAARAVRSILQGGTAELRKLQGVIGESEGTAARAAEMQRQTLTGQLKELKSVWEEFNLTIGEALRPVITPLVQGLQQVLQVINQLPEPVKRFGAITAAVVGVALLGFGTLLIVAGSLIKAFLAVAGVLSVAILVPALKVIAVVAVLAAIATLIMRNWTPIREFFTGLWNIIMEGVENVRAAISQFIAQASATIDSWGPVGDAIRAVWSGITGAIENAVEAVRNLISLAGEAASRVREFGSGVVENIRARGRAVGGHVKAGSAYEVGEFGRELFVPGADGRIVSNNALRGGSGMDEGKISIHLKIDSEGRPHLVSTRQQGMTANLNLDMGLINSYG